MTRMVLPSLGVVAVLLSGLGLQFTIANAQALSSLEQSGSDVAHNHCARCHVVDTKNLFGGISSTPSFPLLVNGLKDWEERFLSFHTRLPHPSIVRFKGDPVDANKPVLTVPVELIHSDIDALVAYARTLKKGD